MGLELAGCRGDDKQNLQRKEAEGMSGNEFFLLYLKILATVLTVALLCLSVMLIMSNLLAGIVFTLLFVPVVVYAVWNVWRE
jgi:hypothetical protein